MKNIISYSLFKKTKKVKRNHDVLNNNDNRYWFNIPFICILNPILFPDFITRFYIHESMSEKEELFKMVLDISSKCEKINVVIKKGASISSQPMLWRMKPMWEDDTNLLFARDIDSIFHEQEIRRMIFFINSDMWLHSIRSHPHHNSIPVFGGLCGFRAQKFKNEKLIPATYRDFVYFDGNKNFNFGDDQKLLVKIFFKNIPQKYISNYYLDCPIRFPCFDSRRYLNKFDKPHLPVRTRNDGMRVYDKSIYERVSLSHIPKNIIKICNGMTNWAGEPIDARGKNLLSMLGLKTNESLILRDVILNNNLLKKFFNLC